MKKAVIITSSVLGVLILGAIIFVYQFSHKSLPNYNKDVVLTGMDNEVEIFRDEYAIPHIYAKTETDLYRAIGYVMAQDRLWQMDLIRRATQGRLSEIFGQDFVDVDIMLRSLRIDEKSQSVFQNSTPEMQKSLEAFADGVNQYVANNKLPIEFGLLGYKIDEWTAQNSLNIIGYISWDLGTAWNAEVLMHQLKNRLNEEQYKSILPDFEDETFTYDFVPQPDTTLLKIEEELISLNAKISELGVIAFEGSNNWAVAGKKSESGYPILANDMHLGLNVPGIWYQIHIVLENEYDVTGLAVPGAPTIVAGHNQNIAWGMTNVMLDDMDFYLETINPENPHQYKFNGEWKDMIVKKEIIKTKEGEEIEKELLFTHRGPIISNFKEVEGEAISMRWLGNEESNEFKGVYMLNKAKNHDDYLEAIKNFVSISQNIIYADKEGNIGLHVAAGVPIRKGDHFSIYPGETDEYDWKGFVPFDSLPQEFNPERGYVSSANNKSAPNDYPYYISHYYYKDYRIDRIREMLVEKEKLSVADFKAMHGDFKSKLVEKYLPEIIFEISKIKSDNPKVDEITQKIVAWDGVLSKESMEAAVFEEFYIVFIKNMVADEMGEKLSEKFIKNKILTNNIFEYIWANTFTTWCDNVETPDVEEDFAAILEKSYLQTIENLKQKMGNDPDKWRWGRIHKLYLEHPLAKVKILDVVFGLNSKPYEVGGSHHTVCPYSYSFAELYKINHGASHRHIYTPDNWSNSQTVIPTGNSGQPASKHYLDQTKLYANNQFHNDLYTRQEVENGAVYKMKILKE